MLLGPATRADIEQARLFQEKTLPALLADATGHGVQAAMRTLFILSSYDRLKRVCENPSHVLGELNAKLVADFPERDLVCAACCVDLRISPEGAHIEYANAAAGPLFVLVGAGRAERALLRWSPVGAMACEWPRPTRCEPEPDRLLLIASDGLLEQMNSHQQRFESALSNLRLPPVPDDALDSILSRFGAFRGCKRSRTTSRG